MKILFLFSGPDLPSSRSGLQLVNQGMNILAIGGQGDDDRRNEILELKCYNDHCDYQGGWSNLYSFQCPRAFHIAHWIPKLPSYINC